MTHLEMFLSAARKRGVSPEKAGDVYFAVQALARRLVAGRATRGDVDRRVVRVCRAAVRP